MQVALPGKPFKVLAVAPQHDALAYCRRMTAADLAAGLYAQRFTVNSTAVAKRLLQQPDELHGLLRGLPALKVGECHR